MKRKISRKKTPLAYQQRDYRMLEQSGLVSSFVKMVETDLHILATEPVEDQALALVSELRKQIEKYIRQNNAFARSLAPLPLDDSAPAIVREMLQAGVKAGVGPMAAVAGAIAEGVGNGLLNLGMDDLIVENGGDIFLVRKKKSTVAVFAGESPLSNKIGVRLEPGQMPCGVCCSSGSVGHSLSLGKADAVVVVAASTALADAVATRLGNEVKGDKGCIGKALEVAQDIAGITGVLIVQGDKLGVWGGVELERL